MRSASPLDLTVIILSFNEARHIARCIRSVRGLASRIVVVDSNSTDGTVAIAQSEGAEILVHPWRNHSSQFNWALDNAQIQTRWIMRLDSDEVVTPRLAAMLGAAMARLPVRVAGITINRQIHFLGRWIRYGGIYPLRTLRVWRTGRGRCENRWMDEHIVVDGSISHLEADIADINLNNINWWTVKHNSYSSREAIDLLMDASGPGGRREMMNRQARIKRFLKQRVYARLPIGGRAFCYFIYRYVFRLGVLDGWQGLAFHFLQGFWYRFLVDVKVYELRQVMKREKISLAEAVKLEFGIDISPESA